MRLAVVDSHTAGEPTRVLTDFSGLRGDSVAEMAKDLDARFGWVHHATLAEPRATDVWVGAILLPKTDDYDFGAIFYNTAGTLGMCGHGTIGLGVTLQHLGLLGPGEVRMGTPVGIVDVTLLSANEVRLKNVVSYRLAKEVACDDLRGDVAFGGNWFYICANHGLALETSVRDLEVHGQRTMARLAELGITGADGAPIDHVEYVWPGDDSCESKNFVICPSGAFDRSPCGTGTSAKLACLAADGKLAPGEEWRVQGISGGVFVGSYEAAEGGIRPSIRGSAHIMGEGSLILGDADPFRHGLRWS